MPNIYMKDFQMEKRSMQDQATNLESIRARVQVNALAANNLYKPLEKRIAMLMHNVASNGGEMSGLGQGLDNQEV